MRARRAKVNVPHTALHDPLSDDAKHASIMEVAPAASKKLNGAADMETMLQARTAESGTSGIELQNCALRGTRRTAAARRRGTVRGSRLLLEFLQG